MTALNECERWLHITIIHAQTDSSKLHTTHPGEDLTGGWSTSGRDEKLSGYRVTVTKATHSALLCSAFLCSRDRPLVEANKWTTPHLGQGAYMTYVIYMQESLKGGGLPRDTCSPNCTMKCSADMQGMGTRCPEQWSSKYTSWIQRSMAVRSSSTNHDQTNEGQNFCERAKLPIQAFRSDYEGGRQENHHWSGTQASKQSLIREHVHKDDEEMNFFCSSGINCKGQRTAPKDESPSLMDNLKETKVMNMHAIWGPSIIEHTQTEQWKTWAQSGEWVIFIMLFESKLSLMNTESQVVSILRD